MDFGIINPAGQRGISGGCKNNCVNAHYGGLSQQWLNEQTWNTTSIVNSLPSKVRLSRSFLSGFLLDTLPFPGICSPWRRNLFSTEVDIINPCRSEPSFVTLYQGILRWVRQWIAWAPVILWIPLRKCMGWIYHPPWSLRWPTASWNG